MIIVISVALMPAGCGAHRAPQNTARAQVATTGQPTASAGAVAAPSTSHGPSARPSPTGGRRPVGTNSSPAGASRTGSVARPCGMGDLRFWLSLATPMAGPYASGSVQMTNIAADRCRVSGYITVRWLDSSGKPMPITVEQVPGSMPGYTSVLSPGRSAFAGLRWTRSRALPSDPDILCPPAPATIEARLSTGNTFARMGWTPHEGLCDSRAQIQPIEMIR